MENYIDGFVLPVPLIHLNEYKSVSEKEDLKLEGTRSFIEVVDLKEDEVIVFGWVIFPSKEIRDRANKQVPADSRMTDLVTPLTDPNKLIFDAERMVYGGFHSLVQSNTSEVR
jgi:uncharacterized protein YbaA (DUF1428 family)